MQARNWRRRGSARGAAREHDNVIAHGCPSSAPPRGPAGEGKIAANRLEALPMPERNQHQPEPGGASKRSICTGIRRERA